MFIPTEKVHVHTMVFQIVLAYCSLKASKLADVAVVRVNQSAQVPT